MAAASRDARWPTRCTTGGSLGKRMSCHQLADGSERVLTGHSHRLAAGTCGSTLNSNHLCSSVIHITQPGANPTGIWRGIETRLSIPLSLPNLREGLVPVIDRGLAGVAGTPRFVAAGVISKDAAMNQQHSYDES